MATLAQLSASSPRLALVGLAKNTGKTVAMNALLGELAAAHEPVGVTSVGRDGEQHDVIDFRIEKPLVKLGAGDLLATTDGLLSASGVPHELLERTGIRTPLGEVLLARLKGGGTIEIAGPSSAADTRAVADSMLSHGARRVVVDGAIDRRAASSPDVSDGLVMATGAILSGELEEVVARTAEAVALVRLRGLDANDPAEQRVGGLAAEDRSASFILDDGTNRQALPPRFALTAEQPQVEGFLREASAASWLVIGGAVPEALLEKLIPSARRRDAPLKVLAQDPTKFFLSRHGPDFYARAGIELLVAHPIDLLALTVNPIAPQSHEFDSAQLRALLGETIDGVPIFDVLHPSYADSPPMMARRQGSRA